MNLFEPIDSVCTDFATMGQRYLWIDSLCILQDSVNDWIAESSRMDQVYSQAIFTIVADAAENCTSGFLRPEARTSRETSVVGCDLTSQSGQTSGLTTVLVRQRGDLEFQLPYHDFYEGDDGDIPWTWSLWKSST
ncbi:hypothetical protein IFR05_011811 [Cadophora sp. M221]|nr:hypothetical protein IFR05_011811 [Cadophora sp. M221]